MKNLLFAVVILLMAAAGLKAQERPPHDPIAANFFPPELVMDNQAALNLTDVQKKTIKDDIQKAQTTFNDLEWQLKKESEAMATLLKPPHVEESTALAQLEKIMGLEREIKKTQLTLMVRIKNSLSPGQQTVLRKLKAERDFRYRQGPEGDNEPH